MKGYAYDRITTTKALLLYIAGFGLSTNENDICRAQDIIGHTSIGELEELANSKENIGNYTVSSLLYWVLFKIWNWEDAVRFYNNTTNPKYKELETANKKVKALEAEVKQLKQELVELQISANADKHKIMELKARLFDLMS